MKGAFLTAGVRKAAFIAPHPAPARLGHVTAVEQAARSAELFERARAVTPGGVNSPVRAIQAVGGTPRFMVRGAGPYLCDADGNRYVALVSSWRPMILGHAHPD